LSGIHLKGENTMTNKLPVVDFSDTAIAFHHLSEKQLQKTAWLFGMMNKSWLVSMGSKVGLKAVQWNLPFVESIIKKNHF
jgi:proline dehydrogenase